MLTLPSKYFVTDWAYLFPRLEAYTPILWRTCYREDVRTLRIFLHKGGQMIICDDDSKNINYIFVHMQ